MLIELSVENFRSIRTRQTLSMVAVPRLRKKENTIDSSIDGEPRFPSLLKAAAIYGPNASGKSNLVRALHLLRTVTLSKPAANKLVFPVAPFRFDSDLKDKPSIFEVNFIENRVRYTFRLSLTSERIHGESLTTYDKGSPQPLYERKHEGGQDIYRFEEGLEGGKDLQEAWRKLTGPQSLFLTQAVANSNEELTQLRAPYRWLSELMIESNRMQQSALSTRRLIAKSPGLGKEVAELLSDVDVPVTAIHSKVLDTEPPSVDSLLDAHENEDEEKTSELITSWLSGARVTTTLTHDSSLGKADFDYDEESDGTKNLLGFALPWLLFRQSENGTRRNVLVIDELDSSLHPKLVEALVEKHIQSDLESQLIFTTHDTHLMDTKLLRRDQIWMTERDHAGSTQLRSVHDFEGRESENIEKRYYEGRYRALPIVKK